MSRTVPDTFSLTALYPPTDIPPIPLGAPTIGVPLRPVVTVGDQFFNYLATQYNAGLIYWPFAGSPPTSWLGMLMSPPNFLPNTVVFQNYTALPYIGAVPGRPWLFSGYTIAPFNGAQGTGFVWTSYWWGIEVDGGVQYVQ